MDRLIQNGPLPTSWEGALTTLKEGWRGKNLRINTSDLPHGHSCQNSNERLGQTSLRLEQQSVFEGSQEGYDYKR